MGPIECDARIINLPSKIIKKTRLETVRLEAVVRMSLQTHTETIRNRSVAGRNLKVKKRLKEKWHSNEYRLEWNTMMETTYWSKRSIKSDTSAKKKEAKPKKEFCRASFFSKFMNMLVRWDGPGKTVSHSEPESTPREFVGDVRGVTYVRNFWLLHCTFYQHHFVTHSLRVSLLALPLFGCGSTDCSTYPNMYVYVNGARIYRCQCHIRWQSSDMAAIFLLSILQIRMYPRCYNIDYQNSVGVYRERTDASSKWIKFALRTA